MLLGWRLRTAQILKVESLGNSSSKVLGVEDELEAAAPLPPPCLCDGPADILGVPGKPGREASAFLPDIVCNRGKDPKFPVLIGHTLKRERRFGGEKENTEKMLEFTQKIKGLIEDEP